MAQSSFLDNLFLQNPPAQWATALAAFLVALGVLWGLSRILIRRLERVSEGTVTDLDDLVTELLKKTKVLFILLLATWIGSLFIEFPAPADLWVRRFLVVGFLIQAAFWATGVVNYLVERQRKRHIDDDPSLATALGAVGVFARIAVWFTFILLILQNLGVQITALLATLGVGGIAVALAVQNVLGDLFASLSIVLDKPFVLGDFIVVGDYKGTVEHVGLKTTRIRSLSGEQLVFSNSDLLGSRIKNFKRMDDRRIAFTVGVAYGTKHEKLEKIPDMIREVVESQPSVRFDRSHFKELGPSSLEFETVFIMLTPDYATYMDVQQTVNLELLKRFEEEGIELAYPTQTVFLERGGSWVADGPEIAPPEIAQSS